MPDAPGGDSSSWRSAAAVDIAPAPALFAAAELEVLFGRLGAGAAVVAALATLPLLHRRRLPVISLVCIWVLAPSLDQVLTAGWFDDADARLFALLWSAYSLAARAPLRRSLSAATARLGGSARWRHSAERMTSFGWPCCS